MANKHYIVVHDPEGEFWEGSLIDADRANQLQGRGAAVLPVMPELFKLSGVAGFSKRAWGAGWPLDYSAPRMCCPLTLYMPSAGDPITRERSSNVVYWLARLVADPALDERVEAGDKFEGTLRFTPDSGQVSSLHAGYTSKGTAVSIRELGRRDARGGWTVAGSGVVTPGAAGFYGFALYGTAPGFRVVWVAASLAE
jgi:hypothetical protein